MTFARRLSLRMYALTKLNKQTEQTWVNAQKWLNQVQFDYKKLFGHGLVDRFLFPIPLAFRPTLTEMEMATEYLSLEVIENFEECFKNIYGSGKLHFTFNPDEQELLRENIDHFITEVNEAIREGKLPPKSKMPELVPRVAISLHVFNHTMTDFLTGVPATSPPTEIMKSTLDNATEIVHSSESEGHSVSSKYHFKTLQKLISSNYLLLFKVSLEFLFYGHLGTKKNCPSICTLDPNTFHFIYCVCQLLHPSLTYDYFITWPPQI